jgi:hypothetical protein
MRKSMLFCHVLGGAVIEFVADFIFQLSKVLRSPEKTGASGNFGLSCKYSSIEGENQAVVLLM